MGARRATSTRTMTFMCPTLPKSHARAGTMARLMVYATALVRHNVRRPCSARIAGPEIAKMIVITTGGAPSNILYRDACVNQATLAKLALRSSVSTIALFPMVCAIQPLAFARADGQLIRTTTRSYINHGRVRTAPGFGPFRAQHVESYFHP